MDRFVWEPDDVEISDLEGNSMVADGTLDPTETDCSSCMEWEATLVVEDTPTGDGRMFSADSLTWGELPVSLLWQRQTADGHAGSVIVGNIQSIERDGNRLVGRGTFDVDGENGREALRMVAQQFLRGVSVDVDSITQSDIEFVYPPDDNPDNDEMLLAPELMIFHKARIRAATLCAIPAFIEASIRLIEPEPMEEDMPMDEEYALTAAAVPAHDTATSDASWDAGARVKKLPSPLTLATAKKMFAWYDADAVEDGEISKTACKFPHHEVSADGTPGAANLKACAAGIGALHGARTPTTIPESDRRGVYNHLAAHMRDGGMTPPEFSTDLVTAAGGIIGAQELIVIGNGEGELLLPNLTDENAHEVREHPGTLQAAAYVLTIPDVPPAWWFTEPTDVDMHGALTVTDEGRVYGFLAPAGVAHRSFERRVTVPMGNVDYSRFMGRETFVEGGGRVISGALTMDCGHASTGYSDSDRAMDHYDNACSIVATVAIGERAGKGVWVAGAVVPGITANQISRMMACQLSGDWRPHKEKNGWREFAGALLVPVPGFAMGRSQASVRMEDGELVASAVPVRYAETPHDCGCTVVQEELSAETPGEVIDLSGVASFIARSIGRDVITRQRELSALIHGQEG